MKTRAVRLPDNYVPERLRKPTKCLFVATTNNPSIMLTEHGLNRLMAEEMIEPCADCTNGHNDGITYYHLAEELYGHPAMLENMVYNILAETLH